MEIITYKEILSQPDIWGNIINNSDFIEKKVIEIKNELNRIVKEVINN